MGVKREGWGIRDNRDESMREKKLGKIAFIDDLSSGSTVVLHGVIE